MKKIILTIVIITGLYSVLMSAGNLWKISINEKDIAAKNIVLLDYLKQKQLKEKPACNFDKESCLKAFSIENGESKQKYLIVLTIGMILIVAGSAAGIYSRKNISSEPKTLKERILFRLLEMVTHSLYWLTISLLYFTMQLLVKKEVSGCVISSMFIFYVSGLVGFYTAYFYLTNRFLKNKKLFKWFVGCILSTIPGFILAYLLPNILWIVSTPHSLSNPAFFIGFAYLAFFVVANAVVGTVFKGFFNWIRIVFCTKTEVSV